MFRIIGTPVLGGDFKMTCLLKEVDSSATERTVYFNFFLPRLLCEQNVMFSLWYSFSRSEMTKCGKDEPPMGGC